MLKKIFKQVHLLHQNSARSTRPENTHHREGKGSLYSCSSVWLVWILPNKKTLLFVCSKVLETNDP